MVDPLSVIGTAIALAGATSASVSKLKQLHDAGKDLDSLMEELKRCRIVFQEVERSAAERRTNHTLCQGMNESICDLLEIAKPKLESLNTLINNQIILSVRATGEKSIAKIAWMRHRSRIKALQNELQEIRRALSGVCEAASL
jgi:hypothetical protein